MTSRRVRSRVCQTLSGRGEDLPNLGSMVRRRIRGLWYRGSWVKKIFTYTHVVLGGFLKGKIGVSGGYLREDRDRKEEVYHMK